MSQWSVVYKRAIQKDGSLLFPSRLGHEFLAQARKNMGSYLYANQYQNQIIPDDEKRFKREWIRYFKEFPKTKYTFAFIDPAIGQKNHHDYTAVVIVDVSPDATWYVRVANRYRLTPTEIVAKLFEINDRFKPMSIGVEVVAYQEALLYILDEEMKRQKKIIPVTGVKRGAQSKEARILGLVPRFEWGRIYLAQGLTALEDELESFPRGTHDDVLDALCSIENVVFYPQAESTELKKPHSAADPNYEKWFIEQLSKGKQINDNREDE